MTRRICASWNLENGIHTYRAMSGKGRVSATLRLRSGQVADATEKDGQAHRPAPTNARSTGYPEGSGACATRIIAKGVLLTSASERRGKGRAKLAQKVRVRPSEPQGKEFDEVVDTLNVCRTGIYFASDRDAYHTDMRLFVTYPYATGPGAINQEYIGRVVRIDSLPDGRRGIAVHLQMKLNLGARETVSPLH